MFSSIRLVLFVDEWVFFWVNLKQVSVVAKMMVDLHLGDGCGNGSLWHFAGVDHGTVGKEFLHQCHCWCQ